MALDFVWWCAECEQEVSSPEEHSQIYPSHTYIEKMRWTGDIITPIVPEVVQDEIDDSITTLSGILNTTINTTITELSKYYYIDDSSYKSTTSNVWVTVLSLPVTLDGDDGWYRIGWNLVWGFNIFVPTILPIYTVSTTESMESVKIVEPVVDINKRASCFVIVLNDTTILAEYCISPNINHLQRFNLCGFKPALLNSGVNSIKIKMKTYYRGDTVKSFSTALEAHKIFVEN